MYYYSSLGNVFTHAVTESYDERGSGTKTKREEN